MNEADATIMKADLKKKHCRSNTQEIHPIPLLLKSLWTWILFIIYLQSITYHNAELSL